MYLTKENIGTAIANTIYQVVDYDIIHTIKGNRALVEKQVQKIQHSLKAKGWIITSMVLLVIIENKAYILCGQHRCEAAKREKMEINCLVTGVYSTYSEELREKIIKDVQDDSSSTLVWNLKDYLKSYIDSGLPEYIALQEWMKKVNLDVVEEALILQGKDNAKPALDIFRRGDYEMGDTDLAELRLSRLRQIDSMGDRTYIMYRTFMRAFSKVSIQPKYDHKEFIRILNIPKKNALLVKMGSIPQYVKLIQDIYNHGKSRDHKVFFC
jgi:uncharacterized protein YunC (DUF1805 family)